MVLGAAAYTERDNLGDLIRGMFAGGTPGAPSGTRWSSVDRPDGGFRAELPGQPKELQAPAYNELGASEPIKMIVANPSPDTTFAIAWQDNPPVMRINDHAPDRTLNAARDGMLARTQTTIFSQSQSMQHGYPAMEISARNPQGGILDARLICAGNRLYMLTALFPSADAVSDDDVAHFFDAFAPSESGSIPETLPAASHSEPQRSPRRTLVQR